MKLYLVAPVIPENADKPTVDARVHECVEPIAKLILSHLSSDPALFGVRHAGEVTKPPIEPDLQFGQAQAVRLLDADALRHVLMEAGNPFSDKWMLVRSLVTCRAVLYGHDGEAFVCLPSDAPPLLSPDSTRISVADCSHLLAESDWMDGFGEDFE